MKFSPTLTLALALAAGMAGAAAAQTTATTPPTGTTAAQPQASSTQPQSSVQQQPNYGQAAYGQTRPGTMPQGSTPANGSRQAAAAGANPQVMAAQQRLKALGLYSGPADGIMDPDTRAALANFQRQHGLRDTEGLNQQTMAALSSAQPTATGSSSPSSATPPTGILNNAPAPTAAGGNSAASATRPPTPTTGQAPGR